MSSAKCAILRLAGTPDKECQRNQYWQLIPRVICTGIVAVDMHVYVNASLYTRLYLYPTHCSLVHCTCECDGPPPRTLRRMPCRPPPPRTLRRMPCRSLRVPGILSSWEIVASVGKGVVLHRVSGDSSTATPFVIISVRCVIFGTVCLWYVCFRCFGR